MDRLFPQPITNRYGGAPIAKWVFILLTVITVGRSLAHIFLPDSGAQSIATIPLDSFTSNGGAAVIQIFALWGLSQLLFGLLYIVVLWRYQSLIPLMYLSWSSNTQDDWCWRLPSRLSQIARLLAPLAALLSFHQRYSCWYYR